MSLTLLFITVQVRRVAVEINIILALTYRVRYYMLIDRDTKSKYIRLNFDRDLKRYRNFNLVNAVYWYTEWTLFEHQAKTGA